MSADDLSTEGNSADEVESPKRQDWVQDVQVKAIKFVYNLAKDGTFKGHGCAQAVLSYYLFNMAIHETRPGFRKYHVMPGCTYPAAVAKATSYTPKAVREANIWLHQQRLIAISDLGASILAECFNSTENEQRLKTLAEEGQREAPELKVGPRPKKTGQSAKADVSEPEVPTDEIEHEADLIEPQVLIDRTSGAITEEPNRTSGSTYSSDSSSIYSSDHDVAEPPKAAAASRPITPFEEEEEEAAAQPVVAGGGGRGSGSARYCNDFWVRTSGKATGYFTKTDSRSRKRGEVQVSLDSSEAAQFWKLGSHQDRVDYMLGRLQHRPESRPQAEASEPEDDLTATNDGDQILEETHAEDRPAAKSASVDPARQEAWDRVLQLVSEVIQDLDDREHRQMNAAFAADLGFPLYGLRDWTMEQFDAAEKYLIARRAASCAA